MHNRDLHPHLNPSSPVLSAFPHASDRATLAGKDACINPLLLVLNAASKFSDHTRWCGFEKVSERGRRLVELTMEVEELIYFRPEHLEIEDSSKRRLSTSDPLSSKRTKHDGGGSGGGGGGGGYDGVINEQEEGLTAQELKDIGSKLDDPNISLSSAERAEMAGMLMFERKSRPISLFCVAFAASDGLGTRM